MSGPPKIGNPKNLTHEKMLMLDYDDPNVNSLLKERNSDEESKDNVSVQEQVNYEIFDNSFSVDENSSKIKILRTKTRS